MTSDFSHFLAVKRPNLPLTSLWIHNSFLNLWNCVGENLLISNYYCFSRIFSTRKLKENGGKIKEKWKFESNSELTFLPNFQLWVSDAEAQPPCKKVKKNLPVKPPCSVFYFLVFFIGPRYPWSDLWVWLSLTMRGCWRLNWCDSGWWRYQVNTNW